MVPSFKTGSQGKAGLMRGGGKDGLGRVEVENYEGILWFSKQELGRRL